MTVARRPSRASAPFAASALLIAVTVAVPAHAGDEAAAEALFAEAKKLVAKKRYAEACAKFAESNRLDRGAGTLIHLADCYEKNRQSASAWATYKEAASAAQALSRKDWAALAHKRAAALEPTLARITVTVPAPVDGLEVTRDGERLTQASFGLALPVDVGSHTVAASAPGHERFTTSITVEHDGETRDVVVPKLVPSPPPTVAAPQPASQVATPVADDAPGSGQRTLGVVVAGVGAASLAVGAVTGLMAMSKNNEGEAVCPEAGACASRDAVDAIDSAKSFGTISTVAFGAGAALAVGGALLFFTAPSARDERAKSGGLRVLPGVGPRGATLTLGGTFQ